MVSQLITYVDVPQNSFRTVNLPRPAIGVLVVNQSNVAVSVNDDSGSPTNPPTPAGLTFGYNYFQGLYSPQVGCVGSYQGDARVYFYDGPVDMARNPPIPQAIINIVGTVTATISGPVTLAPTTTVALASGTTITATDVIVEGNTSKLLGLLPQTVQPLNGVNNGHSFFSIASAVQFMLIQTVVVRRDGLMSLAYSIGGLAQYVFFGIFVYGALDLPLISDKPFPAGSQFDLFYEGDADFQVGF